jgi:hypothetical protein
VRQKCAPKMQMESATIVMCRAVGLARYFFESRACVSRAGASRRRESELKENVRSRSQDVSGTTGIQICHQQTRAGERRREGCEDQLD